MTALELLTSSDFLLDLWHIATPPALYRALNRSPQVAAIRQALASGQLTEDAIRRFSDNLTGSIKVGSPFEHDVAIAAIAVALQDRATTFADDYLRALANLKLAEMPMSIRVARECLKKRESMTMTSKTERILMSEVPQLPIVFGYEQLAARFPGRAAGQIGKQVLIA